MPAFLIILVSSLVVSGGIVLFININKNKLLEDIEKSIQERNYEDAEKMINEGEKVLTPFTQRFYSAQILEGKGQFKHAIESYEKSLLQLSSSNYKQSFDIRVKIADLCFKTQMMDKALGYYELVLQSKKDHYEALIRTSEIYAMNQNYSRAKIQLEKVLLKQTNDFNARLKLIKVILKLNQYVEAGRQLREIIKHTDVPEMTRLEAKEMLGEVFIEQKNYLEAIKLFEELLTDEIILGDHARLVKNLDFLLYSLILKDNIQAAMKTFINFETMLKENEIYELKYNMAQAMDKMRRMYPAVLLLHSIFQEKPKFRDVKTTIEKYKDILDNDYIKNIYDQETVQSERYIMGTLKIKRDAKIISQDDYFMFIDEDHVNIINRHLSPLSYEDCMEISQQIQSNKVTRARIRLYSWDPLGKDEQSVFQFNSFEQIIRSSFVTAMKPPPLTTE